jgi:CSLREA domain-containing protein
MMIANLTRFGLRGFLALALTLGLLGGFNPNLRANAAIFQVNTTSDTIDVNLGDGVCADGGGQCSLRAAVMQANALAGQDTIHAPAGLYLLTRGELPEDAAVNGDLDIKGDLILTGAGQNLTFIDGNQLDRVFDVVLAVHAEISDVTIQGGRTTTSYGTGLPGGGVFNNGTLNLTRVTVAHNTTGAGTGDPGGNGGNGGGVYNAGTLTLIATTLSSNTTGTGGSSSHFGDYSGNGGAGGGVFNSGSMTMDSTSAVTQNSTGNGGAATGDNSTAGDGGSGGGIFNMGTLTITGGLINENTTGDGGLASAVNSTSGSGGNGGGINSIAPLTLVASLVKGNQTGAQGAGGGLSLESGTSTLVNDAILDNQAGSKGSGLFVWAATPHLLQTTLSGNSGGDGSAVYLTSDPGGPFSTLTITNTILVNHSVGINVTAGNTVTAQGILWYNTPTTVALATGAIANLSIQVIGDPAFAADGYHLTLGSAAINRGIYSVASTDIDGAPRPYGCSFDLGADEYPGGPSCRFVYISFLRRGK